MWPWHVKMTTQTCWGCYCCSCWWWGTCWLRLWSPILVKMFKFTFCWYLVETLKLVLDQDSEDVWSRNYFGKQNSTLGSVVPLAMFVFVFLYLNSCICIFHCLQLADLLFITLCVPATAADYAFTSVWQFGEILTSFHIFHISYNHSYIIYFI